MMKYQLELKIFQMKNIKKMHLCVQKKAGKLLVQTGGKMLHLENLSKRITVRGSNSQPLLLHLQKIVVSAKKHHLKSQHHHLRVN